MFVLGNFELGKTTVCQHDINTGDHPPIRQLPRHVPITLRGKIDEMVDEMLDKGVIRPSQSPWASPVVLVTKKDGSLRLFVDYRKLNTVTKMNVFQLPQMDDALDMLAHTQYFTTLDLGFRVLASPHGMPVTREDCFLHTIQPVRIQSHAVWPMQCAGHFPAPDGGGACWPGPRLMHGLPG